MVTVTLTVTFMVRVEVRVNEVRVIEVRVIEVRVMVTVSFTVSVG